MSGPRRRLARLVAAWAAKAFDLAFLAGCLFYIAHTVPDLVGAWPQMRQAFQQEVERLDAECRER